MAYAGIREVGCHFEQCNDGYGFVKDAVFVCVYGAEYVFRTALCSSIPA